MERHNSCLNTRAIIEYIERRGGPVEALLVGLDEELGSLSDPITFLKDAHNWVSSEVCGRMYANAKRITGDTRVAYKIGFESVSQKRLGYIQQILLRALGSPSRVVPRIKAINDKFNRNKEVELAFLSRDRVVVRLHWRRDLELNMDFCLMNQGIYSAVPTVWGLPPARVEETQCQFRGAPFCEFDVRWENPSLWRRLKLVVHNQRSLLAETLSEIEQDKELLEEKYAEVLGLNQRLQKKVDQLWSIQQASGAILSELDFDKLLPRVLRLFIKEIGYSRGMIMLSDPEAGVLRYMEGVGEKAEALEPLAGYEVPLSRTENILVRVAQSGQPVIVEDASSLNLNPNNVIIRNFRPQSFVLLPLMSRGRVIGVLGADRGERAKGRPNLDREYLQGFANQVALAIENARMYEGLRESFLSTVQALASALEAKDAYTRGHSERVTRYSVRLAERIGLPAANVEQVRNMCLLHDVGKIGIDGLILNKKGRLLDREFDVIRQHPVIGAHIIAPLKLSPEEVALVRNHHERFDGQGYPDGLSGENIPLPVRVAVISDAFDAMTSDRPYREALPVAEALGRLKAAAGTQLDPELVDVFAEMVRRGEVSDILSEKVSVQAA